MLWIQTLPIPKIFSALCYQ